MVQEQTIILWKKADEEDRSFEEIALEIFEVLSLLQNCPENLRPNYLTVSSLNNAVKFTWSLQNFMDSLKEGVNREGDRVFEELGYSISFFSSFDEKDSCSIMVGAGIKSKLFWNTLIIHLPSSLDLYDRSAAVFVTNLFQNFAQKYTPFWGCISNDAIPVPRGIFLEGNLPTGIHWINYWSDEIVHTVGMERIYKAINAYPSIVFKNGILLIKDTALDINKEEDIQLYERLNEQLFQ